ncbi:hypothetical protein CEXT_600351 [Caerostris extrusa]|uniref:Uncharacterized protein n=1 Tax=Caerostris extrusa TaxID=172846 RepID=A0AAV4UN45_CAEEX|nr:hypothetical protein CEXT_600351 [Caerostris extrusa]
MCTLGAYPKAVVRKCFHRSALLDLYIYDRRYRYLHPNLVVSKSDIPLLFPCCIRLCLDYADFDSIFYEVDSSGSTISTIDDDLNDDYDHNNMEPAQLPDVKSVPQNISESGTIVQSFF